MRNRAHGLGGRWLCSYALAGLLAIGSVVRGDAWQTEPGQEAASSANTQDEADAKSKPARPPIYDETADAAEQIQAALSKAGRENRRVLIQWGGNWCGWCYRLHDIMREDPEIARTLMYEYDVVLVDIGRMDKNQELLEKYEVDLKQHGVPFITILDSAGHVVVQQETSSLEKDDMENPGHDREAVLSFLVKHKAEPWNARNLLAEAVKRAEREEKLVFLHFGAPWCGWCHRLEAWLEKPDIKAAFQSHFVDLKVDTDRMPEGDALLNEYCKEPEGIPWFVFIDPRSQKVIASSTGPKGNVGFPFEDFEIDHFCTMLQACGERFNEATIAEIRQSLIDNRQAIQARPAQTAAGSATESGR